MVQGLAKIVDTEVIQILKKMEKNLKLINDVVPQIKIIDLFELKIINK